MKNSEQKILFKLKRLDALLPKHGGPIQALECIIVCEGINSMAGVFSIYDFFSIYDWYHVTLTAAQ